MLRCIVSLVFWIAVARWSYAEIELNAPQYIPLVDSLLERITPTTHDKWPRVEVSSNEEHINVKVIPVGSDESGKPQEYAIPHLSTYFPRSS
ncbi:MAG: hypothetical protein KDD70_10620 [Bdellovibrionales bacterium]|nr:hypothetical protein [Bdellovibrionales bacterium]